ncbi:MAG: sugar transferase [Lacisediminihabitans sp.]
MSELEQPLPLAAQLKVNFGRNLRHLRAVELDDPASVEAARATPVSGLRWARKYRSRLRLTDLGLISAVLLITFLFPSNYAEARPLGEQIGVPYWLISAVTLVTWTITLSVLHTRSTRVVGVGLLEYKQVVGASILALAILTMAFTLFNIDIARRFYVLVFPLGILCLVAGRWFWRNWLSRQRRFGHYLSEVVVVGTREDVEYVARQIVRNSGAAYTVVCAVVDEQPTERLAGHAATNLASELAGVPMEYGLNRIAGAAAEFGADAVIVASYSSAGGDFVRRLAWELEGTATELILASRLVDVAGPRIHFRPVDGLPLIHVEIPSFEGGKHVLKRALDVAASSVAIVLLLPLCAVLAVLITSDSPGPVLFWQERVGREGRIFRMLKFRSMVVDAADNLPGLLDQNEGSGVLFKLKNDPRVTRIGQVLRKYSLDEVPQLWNILKGDMSLVGPRPPLLREVEQYEADVNRRLYIKPGLTGMWQVNGRSNLSWQESVRLDLYYVENWSLIGDIIIIWRTFRVLVHPVGAY